MTRKPPPGGGAGSSAVASRFWWTELGIKQIYIAPDLNYAAAVHADRWIPILPNTDAALYLAIAYWWFKHGTYDKEYLATHAYGVDKFEAYVMGEEDGVPKSPEWAAPITGVPARVIKALADEWACKRTTIVIGNGGPGIRGPYSTEPARLQVLCLAMQGLGRPGCNQAKMIEWALERSPDFMSAPSVAGVAGSWQGLSRRRSSGVQHRRGRAQDPGAQADPGEDGRVVRQPLRHAERPDRAVRALRVPGGGLPPTSA